MDFIQAAILGFIEGITEFLPISSTGHLVLTSYFLQIPESDFLKSFTIVIQLGAIGAVLFLYGKTLLTQRAVLLRTLIAFIPTGIIGFLIYKIAKEYLLANIPVILIALFIGGILMLFFERWHTKKEEDTTYNLETMPYKHAVLIGIFQSVAIIPGVSRAAATIIGGLWLGMSREAIVRFSFLLAIPTMVAASGYDIYKNIAVFSNGDITALSIGFITSFITALFAIRFLLAYIKTHSFKAFAYYRIGIAFVLFFFFYVWL